MPMVQVKLIKGVFDQDQKQEMIHKITETMVGIEGEALRSVTWVLVEEIESGDWGIGGHGLSDPGREGPPVGQVLTRRRAGSPHPRAASARPRSEAGHDHST